MPSFCVRIPSPVANMLTTRLQRRHDRNLSSSEAAQGVGNKKQLQKSDNTKCCMWAGKIDRAPGEEAFEKGFDIKLRVWHDTCVQVEVVQPVIPAAHNPSHKHKAQVCSDSVILLWVLSSHLSLTSCAAAMTEEMLLVSSCSRATWAAGWEARRAERAAWARRMFLQARHSCRPSVSWERRRSHSARPIPLQADTCNVLNRSTGLSDEISVTNHVTLKHPMCQQIVNYASYSKYPLFLNLILIYGL